MKAERAAPAPPVSSSGIGRRYWQVGEPSTDTPAGGVAVPTKIPQVLLVVVLDDVALQPEPLAAVTVIVFPGEAM